MDGADLPVPRSGSSALSILSPPAFRRGEGVFRVSLSEGLRRDRRVLRTVVRDLSDPRGLEVGLSGGSRLASAFREGARALTEAPGLRAFGAFAISSLRILTGAGTGIAGHWDRRRERLVLSALPETDRSLWLDILRPLSGSGFADLLLRAALVGEAEWVEELPPVRRGPRIPARGREFDLFLFAAPRAGARGPAPGFVGLGGTRAGLGPEDERASLLFLLLYVSAVRRHT